MRGEARYGKNRSTTERTGRNRRGRIAMGKPVPDDQMLELILKPSAAFVPAHRRHRSEPEGASGLAAQRCKMNLWTEAILMWLIGNCLRSPNPKFIRWRNPADAAGPRIQATPLIHSVRDLQKELKTTPDRAFGFCTDCPSLLGQRPQESSLM